MIIFDAIIDLKKKYGKLFIAGCIGALLCIAGLVIILFAGYGYVSLSASQTFIMFMTGLVILVASVIGMIIQEY